jgi:hypothetical protein
VSGVGFDTLIKKDAGTADTLRLIVATAQQYSKKPFSIKAAAELCPPGTSREQCLKNVFEFYCRNVSYILDEPKIEKVYTPERTLSEGAGDCKKAAVFIASILIAAGIEPIFKHVYYEGNGEYTHIYIIVPDPDLSNYITLDPTNKCQFNKEVRFSKGSLYFINGEKMELHQMGAPGPDPAEVITFTEEVSQGASSIMGDMDELSSNLTGAPLPGKGVINHPKHGAEIQAHIKQGKNVDQAALHVVTKSDPYWTKKLQHVPLSYQRGAFLELVKNNVDGIATHLAAAMGPHPEVLNNLWTVVGGDIATLKKAVIEGAQRKADPIQDKISGDDEQIAGFFKKLLHIGGGILKAVGSVVSIVAPAAGNAIKNVGIKAQEVSANVPATEPNKLKEELKFAPMDRGSFSAPAQAGSFFSPAGFIFKSILLINLYNFSPGVSTILSSAAIGAPLMYMLYLKLKN